ncbi:hypothetical protein [Nocardia sp. NBC_00416]|uniref:hypothetical protein n=1 Tax=Nocardia sp. NBC_00416 TaxID=2975991 RepID=UPI002E2018DE
MTAWHATCDAGFGPYTMLDLYDRPEGGKGFELEDGWLVEVAAGARGVLDGGSYRWEPTAAEGDEFTAEIEADITIRVAFDPAVLIEI